MALSTLWQGSMSVWTTQHQIYKRLADMLEQSLLDYFIPLMFKINPKRNGTLWPQHLLQMMNCLMVWSLDVPMAHIHRTKTWHRKPKNWSRWHHRLTLDMDGQGGRELPGGRVRGCETSPIWSHWGTKKSLSNLEYRRIGRHVFWILKLLA